MNKIQVAIKQVYGVERIYPICEIAKKLNRLMNSKTFTRDNIQVIKSLGYSVEVISESL
jgi:hypothetical protein